MIDRRITSKILWQKDLSLKSTPSFAFGTASAPRRYEFPTSPPPLDGGSEDEILSNGNGRIPPLACYWDSDLWMSKGNMCFPDLSDGMGRATLCQFRAFLRKRDESTTSRTQRSLHRSTGMLGWAVQVGR